MEKLSYEYHPLLLKESSAHYDFDGVNSNIIEFECTNTISGALGACSYNIIKYKNRDKGTPKLDEKKRRTFEQWQELLRDLMQNGYDYDSNLRFAMMVEYPKMKYSLRK